MKIVGKRARLLGTAAAFALCLPLVAQGEEWKELMSRDFTLDYPASFTVARKTEREVWIASPDRRVELYACPWSLKAPHSASAARGERLVSQKTSKTKIGTVVWRTFRARSGGYRAVEVSRWPGGWRVVGLKYRTPRDLRRYHEIYLGFKESIIVFDI